MNKNLLKIMEILDKDGFCDKEFKFGCVVSIKEISGLIYGSFCGPKIYRKDIERLTTEKLSDLEIIGQIHLGHILQRMNTISLGKDINPINKVLYRSDGRFIYQENLFGKEISETIQFPTATPIERSEEECKNVLDFMLLVDKK